MPIPTFTSIRKLFHLIRRADCILIHDAMYFTSAIAALAAIRYRKPVVLLVHVWRVPYRSWVAVGAQACARALLGTLCLRAAAAVITYNRGILAELQKKIGPSKCHLIANGVHDVFEESIEPPRTPRAQRRVVFAGRFVEKKGLHLVRQAAKKFHDTDFIVCGAGPIDPCAWKLANVRTLLADKKQLRSIFESADLLLLPSRGEGFPLVVQEAMRCGLPCAIFSETWSAWGRSAELFVLLEEDSYLADLESFLATGATEAWRSAIRRYAILHWNWKRTAKSYREIFSHVLASSSGAGPCTTRAPLFPSPSHG